VSLLPLLLVVLSLPLLVLAVLRTISPSRLLQGAPPALSRSARRRNTEGGRRGCEDGDNDRGCRPDGYLHLRFRRTMPVDARIGS